MKYYSEAIDSNKKSVIGVIENKPRKKEEAEGKNSGNKKINDPKKGTFDERYARYLSGEYSFKEVSDIHSEGDIEKLKKSNLGKMHSFKQDDAKMNIAVIHIGYSPEEMKTPEFRKYLTQTKREFNQLFGKDHYNFGFLVQEEEIPLSVCGIERIVIVDEEEAATMKKQLNKKFGKTDLMEFRINPELVGKNYFGAGGAEFSVATGPEKKKDGSYELKMKGTPDHERIHSISQYAMQHSPMYAGDGYIRDVNVTEAVYMIKGIHYEFILEDPKNPGKPVKSEWPSMNEILNKHEDKIKHTNVFIRDRKGKEFRLLTLNPSKNLMNSNFTNEERKIAIEKGEFITDLQKELLQKQVEEFLIGEKRRENKYENEKESSKVNLVVSKSSTKHNDKVAKAKRNNIRRAASRRQGR